MRITVSPSNVDGQALHSLLVAAYAYMDGRIDPPSSLHAMSAVDLAQKAADETLITATSDGELVGCMFCRTEGPWLYVGKMAVAERLQGRGVGRSLMEPAFELARQRGLRGVELETRIELTENHEAFARLGFETVAEYRHEGYSRTTSLTMRATLD